MHIDRCRLTGLASLLVLTLFGRSALTAKSIYVDPCAPGDSDGSSWSNAYLCLQAALEESQTGDEIQVAQGTYRPDEHQTRGREGVSINATGDRANSFVLPDGVVMRGGYAGYGTPDPNVRDLQAHPSVLSGDLLGNDPNLEDLKAETLDAFTQDPNRRDNSFTVVVIHDLSEQTVLDGFTITAGHCEGGQPYETSQGFVWPFPDPNTDGAGAWVSGRPTLTDCTFYRNTTRSLDELTSGGGAVVNDGSEATFRECNFRENIAFAGGIMGTGGAVLNTASEPAFIACSFVDNATAQTGTVVSSNQGPMGGAMASFASRPYLNSCSFIDNTAVSGKGGAVFNGTASAADFIDCTFQDNSAVFGGAMHNTQGSDPTLSGCVFVHNRAISTASSLRAAGPAGGAIHGGDSGITTVANCSFLGNIARDINNEGEGGALRASGHWRIANCLFSGNDAKAGAAVYATSYSSPYTKALTALSAINCTFASNGAPDSGEVIGDFTASLSFANTIFWDRSPREIDVTYGRTSDIEVQYSNVRGGWDGEGNIDADPGFQDSNGPDGIAGSLDDDLRLSLDSPCMNAGDNWHLRYVPGTDLAGQPRVALGRVDMGAYEFQGPFNYYVSAADGNDTNSGLTRDAAFATIQKGIDTAKDGYTILVTPGLYEETINFSGKAITVAGSGGAAVLEAQDDYAVSFYRAEGQDSILKNFIIQGSAIGIFLTGSDPTIRNVTLTKNTFGITAYGGAKPDISNCILWGNAAGDLFDCTARFSCVQQGTPGEGNISEDPLFGDPDNGDYHLYSEGGRYVSMYGLWSFDPVTSPCVDAGDPSLDLGAERIPNGGRINMGAYGGTPEASLSLCVPCVAGP